MDALQKLAGSTSQGEEDFLLLSASSATSAVEAAHERTGTGEIEEDRRETEGVNLNGHVHSSTRHACRGQKNDGLVKTRHERDEEGKVREVRQTTLGEAEESWGNSGSRGDDCRKERMGTARRSTVTVAERAAPLLTRGGEAGVVCAKVEENASVAGEQGPRHREIWDKYAGASVDPRAAESARSRPTLVLPPLAVDTPFTAPPLKEQSPRTESEACSSFPHGFSSVEGFDVTAECAEERQHQVQNAELLTGSFAPRMASLSPQGEDFLTKVRDGHPTDEDPTSSSASSLPCASSSLPSPTLSPCSASVGCVGERASETQEAAQVVVDRLRKEKVEATQIFAETLSRYDEEIRSLKAQLAVATSVSAVNQRSPHDQKTRRFSSFSTSRFAPASAFAGQPRILKATSFDLFSSSSLPRSVASNVSQSRQQEDMDIVSEKKAPGLSRLRSSSETLPVASSECVQKSCEAESPSSAVYSSTSMKDSSCRVESLQPSSVNVGSRAASSSSPRALLCGSSATLQQRGDTSLATGEEFQQVPRGSEATSSSAQQTKPTDWRFRISPRDDHQQERAQASLSYDRSDGEIFQHGTTESSPSGTASRAAERGEEASEETGVTGRRGSHHSSPASGPSYGNSNAGVDSKRSLVASSRREAEHAKHRGGSGGELQSSSVSSKPPLQRVKSRIAATSMMAKKLYGMGRLATGLHYYPGSSSGSSGGGGGGAGVARLTDGPLEKDGETILQARQERGKERVFSGCQGAGVTGVDDTTSEGEGSGAVQPAAEISGRLGNKGIGDTGGLTEEDQGREIALSPSGLVDGGASADSAHSLHGEKKASFPLSLLRLDGGSGRGTAAETGRSTHERTAGERERRTGSPIAGSGSSAALDKGTEKHSSSSSLLQHSGSSNLLATTTASFNSSSSSTGSGGGGGRSWKTLFSRDRFGGAGTSRGNRQQGVSSSAGNMSHQEESAAAAASVFSTAIWIDVILPDWQRQQGTQRFKKLLEEGVPHEVRGEVWKKAVGDQLHITPRLYELLLGRVQHVRSYLMRTSRRYRDRINETMRTEGDGDVEGEEEKEMSRSDSGRSVAPSILKDEAIVSSGACWSESARGGGELEAGAWESCCRCCHKTRKGTGEAAAVRADNKAGTPSTVTGQAKEKVSSTAPLSNDTRAERASLETDDTVDERGQKCEEERSAWTCGQKRDCACTSLTEITKPAHASALNSPGTRTPCSTTAAKESYYSCATVSSFSRSETATDSSSSAPQKEDLQAIRDVSSPRSSHLVGGEISETPNALSLPAVESCCCCCCSNCGCHASRKASHSRGTPGGISLCRTSSGETRTTEGREAISGHMFTPAPLPGSHPGPSSLGACDSDPSYSSCPCGFFNWETDVFAAFQTIGMDLHRTLPRLGACQTSKRLIRSSTSGASRPQPSNSSETGKPDVYSTADTAEPAPESTEAVAHSGVCTPPDPSDEGTDSTSRDTEPMCQRRNSVAGSTYMGDKAASHNRSSGASTRSNSSKHSKSGLVSYPSASFSSSGASPTSFSRSTLGGNGASGVRGEGQQSVVDSQAVQPLPFGVPASHMMYEYLRCVLEAYVMFRPDIGYVQGMAYIAATLLLYMDEYSTFVCLSNLLLRRSLQAFYTFDMTVVALYFRTFDALLAERLPNVAGHFEALGIHSDIFLIEWMYTLFTRCLPFELVGRVWDLFLVEGDAILFQTSLAILAYFQDELQTGTLDGCMAVLSSSTTTHFQAMQAEKFLACFRSMPVTQQRVDSLMASLSTAMTKERQRQQHAALRKSPEVTKKGSGSPGSSSVAVTSHSSVSVFSASSKMSGGNPSLSQAHATTSSDNSPGPTSATGERKLKRTEEGTEEDRGASTSRNSHVGSLVAGSSVFGAFKGKKEDRGKTRGGGGGSREGKKGDMVVRNSPATLW
ncbi:tbc domain-containing protein [Cystoisospora suis]|uniref:Tbc domain-containing protein n=1 Tax=Cystoisospora suis TaxID=483139 RepID=A0A2C6KMV2_9APIC|nr:tbc domain-containing protein [Cystoisospora suis]